MSFKRKNLWFLPLSKPNDIKLRFICFPCAGAGASFYRPWINYLSDGVELISLQLPAREERFNEKNFQSWSHLLDILLENIMAYLNKPYIFFGHSLGGLISFELARSLRKLQAPLPECLFIAASRSPKTINTNTKLFNLSDKQLLYWIKALGGLSPELIRNTEFFQIFSRVIRSDMRLLANYKFKHEPPLNIPIYALGGKKDKAVSLEELVLWKEYTSSHFEIFFLRGGHFFVRSELSAVIKILNSKVKIEPFGYVTDFLYSFD